MLLRSALFLILSVAWAGCPDEPASSGDIGTEIHGDTSAEAGGDGAGGDTTASDGTQSVDAEPDKGGDAAGPDAASDSTVEDGSADSPGGDAPVDAAVDDSADGGATDGATGDTGTGDAGSDDTVTGDTATNDAGSSDTAAGDTNSDASAGDSSAADTGSSDSSGDAVPDTPSDVTPPAQGCPTYHEFCDGQCVNIATDAGHCGGCGVSCTAPQVCSAGQCKDDCLPGLTPCGGTCINTDTDSDNCGTCGGGPCPDGQGCVNGACQPALDLGDPPAECSGFESPIVLEYGGSETCLGDQAQVEFTWAVCACEAFTAQSMFFTDAYDSTTGPYEPGEIGGGVGANGAFLVSNDTEIGGSLFVSATSGATSGNRFDILGEAHSGGLFNSSGGSIIGYDAYIAGDVLGIVEVGGTLHTPATSTIGAAVTYGSLVNEPVVVEPPCRCGEKIDVAGLTAAYATNNDNALIGLDPAALVNPPGKLYVELPCGVYYLDAVDTFQDLTIVAKGRVALLVGGNFTAANKLQMMAAPSGELDVFIGGTLNVSNNVTLGSPNYPALMRIYVGGAAPLVFSNNATIGAFMYAAHSDVEFNNNTTVYGGLIANDFTAKNSFDVHYDRGVLAAGADCPDPPTPGDTCTTCADCGNQACVDGFCGACTTSADCCSPLICAGGQCISLSVTP